MRISAILIVFFFFMGILQAQENSEIIEKGILLTLGEVTASGYQHIDFPRKKFIIKRGAIANFNALEGEKVVVKEIRSENGATKVMLARKNGLHFFRFWPTVEANLEKALVSGEIKAAQRKILDSLAK